jgi:hypothetical protein
MRLSKPIEIDGVSQTLAKGNYPVCVFLKNSQSTLLQGGFYPEEVRDVCMRPHSTRIRNVAPVRLHSAMDEIDRRAYSDLTLNWKI